MTSRNILDDLECSNSITESSSETYENYSQVVVKIFRALKCLHGGLAARNGYQNQFSEGESKSSGITTLQNNSATALTLGESVEDIFYTLFVSLSL